MKTKDVVIIILVMAVAILGTYIFLNRGSQDDTNLPVPPKANDNIQVDSYEDCVNVTGYVSAIYPGRCVYNGKTYVEDVEEPLSPTEGGDKDEHGCIGSAGYVWCEQKNKCLRGWEEECGEDKDGEIISALADEYNKEESEVSITITKEEGDYVRGGVTFAPGGRENSGMFLAAKVNGEWEIVYNGNGQADCNKLINIYEFPMSLLTGFCDLTM